MTIKQEHRQPVYCTDCGTALDKVNYARPHTVEQSKQAAASRRKTGMEV